MTDEEMLNEIFRIYKPAACVPAPEYRVYYNDHNEIVCFSQEILDMPYDVVSKEWYITFCPDLFEVKDGKVVKKQIINQNKLQLKREGAKFYSIKNNSQIAVAEDHNGDKDSWDLNYE
jgi:hypothetical protein